MDDLATPLVVAAAPNGARRTRADHPAPPLAPDNAALVDQVRRGAALLGRPLADIDRTRALLAETAA